MLDLFLEIEDDSNMLFKYCKEVFMKYMYFLILMIIFCTSCKDEKNMQGFYVSTSLRVINHYIIEGVDTANLSVGLKSHLLERYSFLKDDNYVIQFHGDSVKCFQCNTSIYQLCYYNKSVRYDIDGDSIVFYLENEKYTTEILANGDEFQIDLGDHESSYLVNLKSIDSINIGIGYDQFLNYLCRFDFEIVDTEDVIMFKQYEDVNYGDLIKRSKDFPDTATWNLTILGDNGFLIIDDSLYHVQEIKNNELIILSSNDKELRLKRLIK